MGGGCLCIRRYLGLLPGNLFAVSVLTYSRSVMLVLSCSLRKQHRLLVPSHR